MKSKNIIQIGGIFFLIGLILITYSWYYSFPIHLTAIDEVTFSQFFSPLWPGLALCLIGIFLIGYYSRNIGIQAGCGCLSIILLYIPAYFFSYISSSDCGNVRSMFLVFQKVGLDSHIISYFEFPNYFILNNMIHQMIGLDDKGVAFISFTLYGILLALFLYLIFLKGLEQKYNQLLVLLIIIYFIGMFSYLNYQWVPQTLALIYFFLFIYLSIHLFTESLKIEWRFITILIFISLVLTHSFLPLICLLFFGILTIKKKYLLPLFLVLLSIFIFITVYYTMTHFQIYIEAFRESIKGFEGRYTSSLSRSFGETEGIIDQLISMINRIRVPLIWIIATGGTLLLILKRKFGFIFVALGLAGGIYLVIGIFYSVLGLRSFQILFIPFTIGVLFFYSKWKKLTIFVIFIILILAIFGPMRIAYNNTQFQTDEEAITCNFLANNLASKEIPKIATDQVNYGYTKNIYSYLKNSFPIIFRPGEVEFLNVFNSTMDKREYVIYNTNLGKEILENEMTQDQFSILFKGIMLNNKIYDCGQTFIINGNLK